MRTRAVENVQFKSAARVLARAVPLGNGKPRLVGSQLVEETEQQTLRKDLAVVEYPKKKKVFKRSYRKF